MRTKNPTMVEAGRKSAKTRQLNINLKLPLIFDIKKVKAIKKKQMPYNSKDRTSAKNAETLFKAQCLKYTGFTSGNYLHLSAQDLNDMLVINNVIPDNLIDFLSPEINPTTVKAIKKKLSTLSKYRFKLFDEMDMYDVIKYLHQIGEELIGLDVDSCSALSTNCHIFEAAFRYILIKKRGILSGTLNPHDPSITKYAERFNVIQTDKSTIGLSTIETIINFLAKYYSVKIKWLQKPKNYMGSAPMSTFTIQIL